MRRAVLAAGGLAAAACLLALMRWTTPGYAELTGPLPVTGAQGEKVFGRTLAARVVSVRLADALSTERFGKAVTYDTGGVFALVTIEAEAVGQTGSITAAAWVGPSGRSFRHTDRVTTGAAALLLSQPLQPGLPRSGLMVFELPADEVAGGELRLSRTIAPRLDSELRIRLDAANLPPPRTVELRRGG